MESINGNRNQLAAKVLVGLGFPKKNVRQAMPKLIGMIHEDIADKTGLSRQNVNMHLAGNRKIIRIQNKIAEAMDVERDLIF